MRFDNRPESVFFIGIAGGSSARKSTFARRLREAFGEDYCQILSLDCYDREGRADFELLRQHLLQLQSGIPVNVPSLSGTTKMYPADIIIVEGEHILSQPAIVELLSDRIFIETPESLQLDKTSTTHCITDEQSAQQVIDELIDKLGIDS